MGTVAKAASGLTAAGGLTGAAYGTYDYKTATVEYSLSFDDINKFELVEEGGDKEAQFRALAYSYVASASSTGREIPGFNLVENDEENWKKLSNKCKELRSTSIRFKSKEAVSDLEGQIICWCAVIKDVREALFHRERRSIVIEKDGDNKDSEWKALITSNSDKDGLRSFLGITETSVSEEHFSQLKTKCNDAFSKEPKDTEYQTSLGNARKYCVKSQAS